MMNSLRLAPRYAAATVAAMGYLVLVGWALDIDFLRRIMPGLVAMNPMTAIAFIVAALSLWLLWDEVANNANPTARRIGRVCAFVAAGIGFLKLIEIASGWEIGVDRLLFSDKLATGGTVGFPNRMAPNTALNFCLVGCALLLLDWETRRGLRPAQLLCLASGASALLAIVGYAYGTASLYVVASFIPMALHTAVTFAVLLFGILYARPTRGLMAIVTDQSIGGITARRLLTAAICIPVVLGWLRLVGERAGFYDTATGTSLFAVSNVVVFSIAFLWTCSSLARLDAERKLAAENLGRLQQQQELILDSISDGIHVIDSEGRILFENPAAVRALGWNAHELDGKPAHATIHYTWQDGTAYPVQECPIYATLNKNAVARYVDNEVFWRKDGSSFAVEYSSTPIQDAEGKATGAVVSFRDITVRKQNEMALEQAKAEAEAAREEAERANAAKSEFLSRMSHELRTPLNAILGFAQLMEMDELEDGHRDGVKQILKGGRHLLELVNEVLDIARIEAGEFSLSAEPVQLHALVQETIALVEPLGIERHIRFENSIGVGFVLADQQRLKQVLLNLLANAVKYNREGGLVRLSSGTATIPGRVRFEVTDTGPGISPAGLEKLFLPFERLDAAQKGVEGTGIGLTISQRLVQLMGGEIGVYSIENEGSTFWVELPGAQDPMQAIERRATTRPVVELTPVLNGAVPNGAAHTILYIEDNLSNLNLIEHILSRRADMRLLSAMQGRRGLELARDHRPHLILLDLHLPDMPGDEVLQHLRAETETREIPVVMLSADATPRQIERLLEAGATAYLTKPLNVKQFLAVLDENLRN